MINNKMFVVSITLQLIAAVSAEPILNYLSDKNIPEDGRLNFSELCVKYGHKAEDIEVQTEDGYILKLFHIPGEKKPVFLLHGQFDSADTWILRGKNSLAITLADSGYAVWLGNARGNKYSRKHVTLNPNTDARFWDFSFEEMGLYDFTAMVDKILNVTNETKIDAIGHSQGTTAFFALMSLKPEYNKKINQFIALAPATFFDNAQTPVPRPLAPIFFPVLKLLGINELLADRSSAHKLFKVFCTKGLLTESVCSTGLFLLGGFDPNGLEPEFIPILFGHFPAGASRKCLVHNDQISFSGRFARFDNGWLNNLRMYESISPPEYNLTQVSAKVSLFYGKNDLLASMESAQHLARLLPNVVAFQAIAKEQWNHFDFIWGSDMKKYLFGHIFQLLEKYN